jgi:hypothetical protein
MLAPESGAYINEVLPLLLSIIVSRPHHLPTFFFDQLSLLTYHSLEGRSIRAELPTDFLGLELPAPFGY